VTLTGLGGIGKTRLALEVAWKGCEAYPDGVWLIELAALTDPALLPQTIAGTFGIQAEGARAPVDTLVTTLRDAALLLVLDNCEHLITACAGLVEILLDACPNLHILATSREALRLSGEFPWLVPSLPLPDPDAGLIELAENDAVRLFVDRVRWHRPGFALTQENAGVAGAICRQLGGLPLALELAAARAAFLALPQLADRLSDALDVLAGGSRSAPTRQQTLRATLDWSYALLGESEQTIFRRLAVFAGGWTLVEAESICASGQLAKHEILDLLGNLVAKSLVQVDLTRDEARYRLLEPVRQYAMSLLEASGEANSVRERHALYLLTFLEEIEPELSGPHQADWFSHLDREHDNLRAALRWALEQGEAETALRMCAVLWRFWGIRWHSAEGLAWLAEVRALPTAGHSASWARAALGGGELARRLLDFDRARALLEESLEVHRKLGDSAGIAWSQAYLANALGMAGDFHGSRAHAQAGLKLFRDLDDRLGIARTLNTLAEDARLCGDYTLAAQYYEEVLSLDRQLGDQQGIAIRLHNLGYVALHEGDMPRAVRSFRESYLLDQQLGYQTGALSFLEGMAAAASAAERPEQAARLYGAWEAHCARPGTEFKLHPPDQAEYDRSLERVRAAITEAALARAWTAGAKLTLDHAIAEALAFVEEIAGTDSGISAGRAEPLTHREWEIARLVAQGLTNHQIADALQIAERTVDTHVSHILRKLRTSTRHQIATRLSQGDFEPVNR
jgi:non-specific serine/threonine protein kinase